MRLSPAKSVPGLPDWEIIDTPGHTPGHVSFFRRSDAVLLAGDAVTTMNLDGFIDTVTRRREVCRPPVPATLNWEDARRSVKLLANLRPSLIRSGPRPAGEQRCGRAVAPGGEFSKARRFVAISCDDDLYGVVAYPLTRAALTNNIPFHLCFFGCGAAIRWPYWN